MWGYAAKAPTSHDAKPRNKNAFEFDMNWQSRCLATSSERTRYLQSTQNLLWLKSVWYYLLLLICLNTTSTSTCSWPWAASHSHNRQLLHSLALCARLVVISILARSWASTHTSVVFFPMLTSFELMCKRQGAQNIHFYCWIKQQNFQNETSTHTKKFLCFVLASNIFERPWSAIALMRTHYIHVHRPLCMHHQRGGGQGPVRMRFGDWGIEC